MLQTLVGFWGQFRKINEDDTIDEDDKFQYLLQATVIGSPSRELVESYPPSGTNYKKAVAQHRCFFDVLVRVAIARSSQGFDLYSSIVQRN